MSDGAAVAVAVAAAAGALAARPLPLLVPAVAVAAALLTRWPWLLGIGVALGASALAARSWAGLQPPVPQPVRAVVTLVGDPRDVGGALRVDLRLGRRRVEAWARGRHAAALRDRLSGDRVEMHGHLDAVPGSQRSRLATRHVSARLSVEQVGPWSPGALPSRLANAVRRTLVDGASSMPPARRSLFAGFVLGDDRGQPPEVVFDFRASGLTHLLAVSGQNVAFVLALAAPLLRRLGLRGRLAAGSGVLLLFGTVTRWEPSVLRAVAMASIALLATALGRPASTVRLLALAVTGLLLIDPLLVHSVGFRLSVGACLGIALMARPLARLVPGPRPLADALAVTAAAQIGVAPVMVPVFGGLPVAALVANVLASPAAGPLMAWGVAAGLVAGLVGGAPATWVHLPTQALIVWVAGVARAAARLPLGQLELGHLVAVGVAAAAGAVAARCGRRRLVATAGAVAAGALLLPALVVIRPHDREARSLGRGATLWREGQASVLVLDGAGGSPDRLMSALWAAGVRRLDVLVASRPTATEARVGEAVRRRFPTALVLAPDRSRLDPAVTPPSGSRLLVGSLVLEVARAGDRLAVTVIRAEARDPPG